MRLPIRSRRHLARGRIGQPDLTIEMPEPFHVPATGIVDYVYVRVLLPNESDRWVQSVEVMPGEPSAIHHVDIFLCAAGCVDFESLELGVASYLPLEAPSEPSVQNDTGETFGLRSELLFSYLPGGDPWVLPEGVARLLPGGGRAGLQPSLHTEWYGGVGSIERRYRVRRGRTEPPGRDAWAR